MRSQYVAIPSTRIMLFILSIVVTVSAQTNNGGDDLAGAWRGSVQFTTGAFAPTKGLEFMYAFNPGGTMTESSNFDALPPVPPAYGVWKKNGPRTYTAKYQFYQSGPASSAEQLIKNGGWLPDGYGEIVQTITLSPDGNTFTSRLTLELFNKEGKVIPGGGEGTGKGTKIRF